MRILHVTESLGGGVQSAISKYTHMASDSEHVIYGRRREGEATGEYSLTTNISEYRGSILGFLLRIRQTIREFEPDAIHFHSSFAGLGRLFSPRKIPIVYSPHCFAFERTDRGQIWKKAVWLVEFLLAIRPQVIVAVSPYEAKLAQNLKNKDSVFYVPNVLIYSASEVTKSDRENIVMVGRIGEQKDPRMFAAVAERLNQLYDFIWVGDGESDLRQVLIDAGVQVTGWQTPSETRKLVASSHLYLHTGAWEAAPISTIEAAASGTPVLARGIPTMESLGYVVTSSSSEEIAVTVREFFTDVEFRELVVNRTIEVAKRFDVSEAEQRLKQAYLYALSRKKKDEN